jgi:hypothetical protein
MHESENVNNYMLLRWSFCDFGEDLLVDGDRCIVSGMGETTVYEKGDYRTLAELAWKTWMVKWSGGGDVGPLSWMRVIAVGRCLNGEYPSDATIAALMHSAGCIGTWTLDRDTGWLRERGGFGSVWLP